MKNNGDDDKDRKPEIPVNYWLVIFGLFFISIIMFLLSGMGAAGHSRFIYDSARWIELIFGFIILTITIKQRKNSKILLIAGILLFSIVVLSFVFLTYPGIPFYSIDGIIEIFHQ